LVSILYLRDRPQIDSSEQLHKHQQMSSAV
jgi:hypothetical protein